MELDDELYERICNLSEEGDLYFEEDKFQQAIKKYWEALGLIPEPKAEWEASTWLYVAIGEVYFFCDNYLEALNLFNEAMKCPDGVENPLINLRLGQCYYELDKYQLAKEYLLRAYMMEGQAIFENEDEKYLELVRTLK